MRWVAGLAVLAVSYTGFAGQATAPNGGQTPAQPGAQPMTKEQAKELFRSVDEILSFVSADSKLPIEHSVKRKLISRDEVNHYLREKFDEDEGRKRMERSEIVLKKFGAARSRLSPGTVSSFVADGADCRVLRQ